MTYIGQLERGKMGVSLRTAKRIADALGCRLAEMLQTDPPSTSPEQKAWIRQHGTRKQKELLAQEEYLRVQREILKRTFLDKQGKN